jgi:hypothetical protein
LVILLQSTKSLRLTIEMHCHPVECSFVVFYPTCFSDNVFRDICINISAGSCGSCYSEAQTQIELIVFDGFVPFGLAFAAGIMVFITLDEIIAAASQNGHEHWTSFGIIAGSLLTFVLLGFLM